MYDGSGFHIGLPAWAYPGWNNVYFTSTPSALKSYASVFNTVEGNTTFYHIPDKASVANWHKSVEGTQFKFCFKFPKSVTHQRIPDLNALDVFIDRISGLDNYLGPFLLQLPSTVGPDDLHRIETILNHIPPGYRCAIEVRHEDFFTEPALLESMISQYQLGRVIMDTRPVFHGNTKHPEVLAALHAKPDLPVLGQVYNGLMMIRLLLHPDLISNDKYIDQWVARTAKALSAGCDCYMMIHCPNNQHCPQLALDFYNRLRDYQLRTDGLVNLPPLAAWPIPQQQNLL